MMGIALVANPAEQAIELIQGMRADGRSLRAIGRELEERGLPTKGGEKRWAVATVAGILRRNPAPEPTA